MGVSTKNLTRSALGGPRSAFSTVATEILPDWDISLVFVGPTKACTLNKQLRGKGYVPNVLSYALNKKSGEIIICPAEAKKQAPDFSMDERDFILYLFIHGLLHIKGWAHGARMEKCERKLVAKYGAANSHRHRHRDVPGKSGRRRGTLR
ncbi:MAG: rRNA maturation RNase YbeY [Patescibacteria group bacterium]|nr:rRNA maturation RNase YbeY [Patescibacteria group bacterium]